MEEVDWNVRGWIGMEEDGLGWTRLDWDGGGWIGM